MQKHIRVVDEKRQIVQATIVDERWYSKKVGEEGTIVSVPSATWIAGCYPKGVGFYMWLAKNGWDESQQIKNDAADKGSKIHYALNDIIEGYEVRIDSKYINHSKERDEELTLEECDAILSFKRFVAQNNPVSIAWDFTMFDPEGKYAGTGDWFCKIGEEYWLIDFKSGQDVWPSHFVQLNIYKDLFRTNRDEITEMFPLIAEIPKDAVIKMAVLQVGYRRNKNMFKLTEIEDDMELVEATRTIWKREHGGEKPSMLEYPIVLSEGNKKEEKVG